MTTPLISSPFSAEPGRHSSALVRSRAPLRISFAGGGTDLLPYVTDRGGRVLSATINKFAYATLRVGGSPVIQVHSLDYDAIERYDLDQPLIYDGQLDLVKACLRHIQDAALAAQLGLDLYLETDVPPGSGLGSSSALVVALLSALATWRRISIDKYGLARLAYQVERVDVGIAGGLQDQFAAAFGGFNLIEFHSVEDVVVNPLRIDARTINELEYNMLLVFTGATRLATNIIQSQVGSYVQRLPAAVEALDAMKELAAAAKDALLTGRLRLFADILHQDWIAKKATSPHVTTNAIEELYEEALRLGVLGGKVSGAGGGGFMFLYCPFDRKPTVSARMAAMGAEVLPVAFHPSGVETWTWEPGQ